MPRVFASARKLHFPLLADFEPKGAVAKTYGAYRYREGVSERALFVIDGNGSIYWKKCYTKLDVAVKVPL